MKRSIAVTLSAILSLLGSVLTLGVGLLLILIFFILPTTRAKLPPGTSGLIFVAAAMVYILPGIWGLASSIGLFLLKNWARISTIVFSVVLILMGSIAGIVMLLIPLPAGTNQGSDQSVVTFVRWGMGGFWFCLAGIGAWWLILFTRAKVKAQFVNAPTNYSVEALSQKPIPGTAGNQPPANGRPLSITIIAWLLLISCIFFPINILMHTPAMFFTMLITGYGAALYLALYTIANLSIGIGLLRLKPVARIACIVYYVFAFLNIGVFYFAPGGHDRILTMVNASQAMFPWTKQMQQAGPQIDLIPFMRFGMVIGLIGALVPLYFLITRKEAFAAKGTPST